MVQSRTLFDWWSASRPTEGLPSWRDLTENPAPALMGKLAMHEVHSPTRLICRYFGSDLVDLWGRDYTGADIGDAFKSSKAYDRALDVIYSFASHPCGGQMCGIWATERSQNYKRCQSYLPISPTNDGIPLVISHPDEEVQIIETNGEIGVSRISSVDWKDIGYGVPSRSLVKRLFDKVG